jgi:hypothetical protein
MNSAAKSREISYGIYTIERLPKGSRRTPKWDLHSITPDKATAETHAKLLSEQPYFDHIEVQEFQICPETKERVVHKIRSYSKNSIWVLTAKLGALAVCAFMVGLILF